MNGADAVGVNSKQIRVRARMRVRTNLAGCRSIGNEKHDVVFCSLLACTDFLFCLVDNLLTEYSW